MALLQIGAQHDFGGLYIVNVPPDDTWNFGQPTQRGGPCPMSSGDDLILAALKRADGDRANHAVFGYAFGEGLQILLRIRPERLRPSRGFFKLFVFVLHQGCQRQHDDPLCSLSRRIPQKNTEILVAVYIVSSGIELFSKIEFRRSSSPPAQYGRMSAPDQYSVRIRAKIGRRSALPRL